MSRIFFRSCLAPLAVALLAAAPAFAGDPGWTGAGPFPPGNGSERVDALMLDAATGVLYAGTGSGTVFALSDPSLSRPPVALDDSAATSENTAVVIDILANDFDPEDALDSGSVQVQSDPAHGTVSVRTDGTVTYTPAAGFSGADSFTYIVRDVAGLASTAATVVVTVQQSSPDDGGSSSDSGGSGNSHNGNTDGSDGTTPPPPSGGSGNDGGGGAWGIFAWLAMLPGVLRRRRTRRGADVGDSYPPRKR
ncbi:MAG TPA: cadherin-like domain-containing protein [Gammaproteobacteria bacterium]|nr:cadherin-like domain-containing protein [Gammaproteobacteria bacterium]